MCVQNLKFVALSIPEVIGVLKKTWAVPEYAHAPFSVKFLTGFCSDGPCECMYRPYLKFVALPFPEMIAIAVLGWGCEPPILGKGRPKGVGDGTVRKSVCDFL